ncbi:paraslipin [Levilactobacillus namurensis]|nr:SPFH domain-containing protein [Levilactobacillus namurensis]PTM22991.1 SPFH/Band 7/PHB domain protein [Lactobacillus sp. PFC-70]MDT7013596.1 SPFH domain-containing protein [Levilactobacillus namurensis]MDT7019548.1 SPFH domain-containing protein [Levilactobacillus namurensis]WNN65863.1 SPFH domain-containing protein [Levilactobacillus namurensis]GEO74711.1 paraslipin [Levilactobacillus namurensis]
MWGAMLGLLILLIIILGLLLSVKIITQPDRGVVITLGKYNKTLTPGIHLIAPFISHVIRVSTAQTPVDLDEQVVITKDNAEISVKISLKYHVTNIEDFVFKNEDSVRSMTQDTRASLRGIIGNKELNEVLNGTEEINRALFAGLSDVTAGYGLNVDRVNIDSVNPSRDIQDSMNKLLKATRERDAAIATAQGKSKSITLENEANNQALLATNQAQNTALVNSATAKATAIHTEADADAYRIGKLNAALSVSSQNYFISQNIAAFKELANSDANTVVMPNTAIDSLGAVPAFAEAFKATKSAK